MGRRDGERGQMLLLFVAIFSVILAMGAFALDQGLAYGRHGIAQSDADAASRAGAYGCVEELSDGTPLSSACDGSKATDAATGNASSNLVDSGDVSPDGDNECLGQGNHDFPSMTVEVDRQSPSLFSKAFGLTGFTAETTATSCVGEVSTIRSGDITMIPLWFAGNSGSSGSDPNRSNCGAGSGSSTTFAGQECVIFTTEAHLSSSGTFYQSSANCGPANSNNIDDGIRTGIGTFTCSTDDLLTDYYGSSGWQGDILDAFWNRLPASGETCGGGHSIPDGLQAVVTTLEGDPAKPTGANPPGTDDGPSTVYRQQSCVSARLVLIPLVTGGSTKTIQGFTAVYITGCGRDDDGAPNSLNECDQDDRGYRDGGDCHSFDHFHHCDDTSSTRVWGIVLRFYLAGGSVQNIDSIDSNSGLGKAAALAIQTKQ